MNQTMMQYFEWYLPDDGTLWNQAKADAAMLAATGFTMLWLPPAYKGQAGKEDVGYGVYDFYDLGEFDQKGSVRTKYGTKDEYLAAIQAIQQQNMLAIGDIVLNHKMGSDAVETIEAADVNTKDRDQETTADHPVKVWTKFTFPERHGKYSNFVWDWHDFTGTDYDAADSSKKQIMLFQGKEWNQNVSQEDGNFDYIMGDDVDFSSPRVIKELYTWGVWYTKMTGINGFRLDAVKSIDAHFWLNWLKVMKLYGNHPDFAVGEYWLGDVNPLIQYLKDCGHCMKLFDVPLHYHLHDCSHANGQYNLHAIFENTLTDIEPDFAVAFSDNHDTQPGQALESWVMEWFKPHAYALLLLNRCTCPCVFYGDYYGIPHNDIAPVKVLPAMVWIRKNLLAPHIVDYNNSDTQMLCWVAMSDHPVVVIMSIGEIKHQSVSDFSLSRKVFVDMTNPAVKVTMDIDGKGEFTCNAGSCSVYILESDYQRMIQELPDVEHPLPQDPTLPAPDQTQKN